MSDMKLEEIDAKSMDVAIETVGEYIEHLGRTYQFENWTADEFEMLVRTAIEANKEAYTNLIGNQPPF
jgi:NAD(P)H-nitrite reductase large subunit